MSRFADRRQRLRKLMRKAQLPGILVTYETNVRYLTGFTGDSSYLLLTERESVMISDFRYATQLEEECPDLEICIRPSVTPLSNAAAKAVRQAKLSRLAVEGDYATLALFGVLQNILPQTTLVQTSGLVEGLRAIKDKDELAAIREAVRVAERAFAILRATLRPELTEKQLADDLEHNLRLLGAQGSAFSPIVAAGPRAALPHARPGEVAIGDHGLILVDWGAQCRHYKSDLTRVILTGKISPKLERAYGVVLAAQRQAIAAIRPGILASQVDSAGRSAIVNAGLGKYFGHGMGHGIGLDIHEAPRMQIANDRPLLPGMVVTVEPGVYLPGQWGVRIEDDVLVTKDGCEVLTSVPKQLEDAMAP